MGGTFNIHILTFYVLKFPLTFDFDLQSENEFGFTKGTLGAFNGRISPLLRNHPILTGLLYLI